MDIIRIGTHYGGWYIPDGILTKDSVCYMAGAGEDISFDVGVATKYRCKVFIFDPTPRAKIHFDKLIHAVDSGIPMAINNSEIEFYNLTMESAALLYFTRIGLWSHKSIIKFFAPKNPAHVSYSALNLQKTKDYFMGEVNSIQGLMKLYGHSKIDLLKIDIEGAEYEVIDSIIENNIRIKIFCVEFDEANNPLDVNYTERIFGAIDKLLNFGYSIFAVDDNHNYFFLLTP